MKELSVIIPLYNCEDFVNKAIDSILGQKGVDVEVVVVNDGSTDHSVDKLSTYDSRVVLINTENKGASAARNIGLRAATGRYVMFLDADDFLSDEKVCYSVLQKMEDTHCKIGMFLYSYLNNVTNEVLHISNFPNSIIGETDSSKLLCGLISHGIVPMTPCCKIIETEFLLKNKLFFVENTTAEDIEWFIRLMLYVDRFSLVQNDSYMYRKNLSSSVTGSLSSVKVINHFNIISQSTNNLTKLDNGEKKSALLSALAYQFCIWYSSSWCYLSKSELEEKVSSLDWLLEYDMFPKVKYIKWLYKLMGARLYYVLSLYGKLFSKSKM